MCQLCWWNIFYKGGWSASRPEAAKVHSRCSINWLLFDVGSQQRKTGQG